MILRECKCGTKATTTEELELFALSKSQKYGRRNQCKECTAKASRLSMGYTEPKTSAPKGTYTTSTGQVIFSRYGLSEQAHKDLLEKADNKCQICGSTIRLCIDHDHETMKIRGILCTSCNTSIGKLGDTVEGLERAIQYLKFIQ